MKHNFDTLTSDFVCKHCRHHISTDPNLSGVNNRNHCPYCLYSRHMDHYAPGDRLSACKAEMLPIGLALKRTNKKYGQRQGELMIIHQCVDCGKISINRIAADDITSKVFDLFAGSARIDAATFRQIEASGITPVTHEDREIVQARLFGWGRHADTAVDTMPLWA